MPIKAPNLYSFSSLLLIFPLFVRFLYATCFVAFVPNTTQATHGSIYILYVGPKSKHECEQLFVGLLSPIPLFFRISLITPIPLGILGKSKFKLDL